MRFVLAALSVLAVTFAVSTAVAEKRMFIIANNADGYGIDRCLASGDKCGATVAASYCKSRQFAGAASFRKVDRDDITGSIPKDGVSGPCIGNRCAEEFVAIECTR